MSEEPRRPQAERLAEAHALELGAELIRTAGAPRRARFEVEAGGWRVVVEACPASELPDLTPCEADIVQVLRGRRHRLTTSEILAELSRLSGLGKIELHGDSTVRHSLARLARADVGVLTSSRRAPQGYALSDRYRAQDAAAEAG